MTLKFQRTKISEVILIEPTVYSDHRGFFIETYKFSEFAAFGQNIAFVQDNHSRSLRKVLRGLHFQRPPRAIGKLVRAVRGEIFDVAVDIRKGSPTYGKWVGEVLSDQNHRILYVPEGFAHGFVCLSEIADVWYKMTGEYSSDHDTGILWNDPDVGIAWPIQDPILSEKDASLPRLKDSNTGFVFQAPVATL